nr:MAG TPA: protein of unknown function (DUF4802) [Caudoviricetes sp.]
MSSFTLTSNYVFCRCFICQSHSIITLINNQLFF